MTTRRFELVDDRSSKYWEVAVDGAEVTVRYGRIGTVGRTQTKGFETPDEAHRDADRLMKEKAGKGYLEVASGGPLAGVAPKERPVKPASPTGPMSEAVFWELVSLFNWKKTGDDDAVLRPAVTALSRMSVEDITAFDDLLAEKLYALDTREICRATYRGELDPDDGDAYVSADDFLYARCVIVANGKELYEAALANPLEVPQGMEFESLLHVARSAYEKKLGGEYDHMTPISWESFSNQEGWKKTGATRPGRYTGDDMPPGNRRPT